MADPFIGEIRIFAGNFAPRDWTFCNGTTLNISQNTALFSILGTIYGGDGRTTFKVPNLQGRAPLGTGQGPGLNNYPIGHPGGVDTVTLNSNQIPSHGHNLMGTSSLADSADPSGHTLARTRTGVSYFAGGTLVNMAGNALDNTGGNGAHNNLQPYLVVNFIIALNGLYPSRP